jgi:gamma-glutamylcyclotransferase
MIYFAYGSNMLTSRIVSRCPGTKEVGRAWLVGYALRFDKLSSDGSGKCTIRATSDAHDIVHGVLFSVPSSQVSRLDHAEAEGIGYDRMPILVAVSDSETLCVETYIAKETAIVPNAKPYDWYLAMVIKGALSHDLPNSYIQMLRQVQAKADPNQNRRARLLALKQLKAPNPRI